MRMFIASMVAAFIVLVGVALLIFFYSFAPRVESGSIMAAETSAGGTPEASSADSRKWSGNFRIYLAVATALAGLALIALAVARGYRQARKRICDGVEGFEDDPLRAASWAMWFFLLLILAALLIPPIREMILLMAVERSGISQVILALMSFGAAICLFHYHGLKREFRHFSEAGAALAKLSPADPNYLAQMTAIFERSPNGAFKSKWKNLMTAKRMSDGVPDFETLVSLVDEREILRESKATFSIKALPLLGLLGTVVGFSVALVGMKKAAANMVDFSSFKGHMLDTLGGMQTAFLTTLGGIGGMLVVLLLNSMLCEARKRIMLLEDECLYLHVFLPVFKASKGKGE